MSDHACTELSGVGPKLAERLAKCNIHNLHDLLFHLPYRYQDRTRITPIMQTRLGDYTVVEGVIQSSQVQFGQRRSFVFRLQDQTGSLQVRLFHFSRSQQEQLSKDTRVRCFGEIRSGFNGREMIHPEYRVIGNDVILPVEENLTPIYHTTAGLTQTRLRQLTQQALTWLQKQGAFLTDYIPAEWCQEQQWMNLLDALAYVHRPPPDASVQRLEEGKHPAQRRLAFEELLAHHLCLRRVRAKLQQQKAPALTADHVLLDAFIHQLPFQLTQAQQCVYDDIVTDLNKPTPMLRLVQGDVGSGKTVVAALAALSALGSGYQVAIMAPTEILAEQHYDYFNTCLSPLKFHVMFLTGKMKAKARRESLADILSGQAQVIVGTHALFQQEVQYHRLGLIIIDEQHRFGVKQRLALQEKGQDNGLQPHQLIMTATPIPRTLAMTAYADLDVSVIDELPPGRKPIKTVVIADTRRAEVIERIQAVCAEGRQVYWVCTLIEESDVLQCQAAEKTTGDLQQSLPQLQIGLVHGRLSTDEKETIMQAFKCGEIDVLVATTVIEVGVNVPNANLIIIENPERLGLAQLHQLRGRVGRGEHASFCVLLYKSPLSQQAQERLKVLRDSQDGFVIAQHDLTLRGAGELLGTRQTGLANMRIADLQRDADLIETVHAIGTRFLSAYPERVEPLLKRWLPEGEAYATV